MNARRRADVAWKCTAWLLGGALLSAALLFFAPKHNEPATPFVRLVAYGLGGAMLLFFFACLISAYVALTEDMRANARERRG